ncbi:MAG TPA: hypothetical protein VIV63_12600 [Steroidobacteraceae bacterium]
MARLLLALLLLPLTASAADEGRFSFLEQEVRNLQRQVQVLSRQMDEMRLRPDRIDPQLSGPRPARGASPETNLPRWVDASTWKKIRPGMSELEVISSLGPPTSMREEGGSRVLLYAMEIGPTAFLGGSVAIRNRAVVEVNQPALQ